MSSAADPAASPEENGKPVKEEPKDTSASRLILLGVLVLFLMIAVSWNFSVGKFVAGSFRLEDMQVCEELDEKMLPLQARSVISGGARQICLWFMYSRARDGDFIDIVWAHGERNIQKESFRLVESKGSKAFFLLRQDGSEFSAGDYSVSLYCNGREKGLRRFSIEAADDSEIPFSLEENDGENSQE